MHTNMILQISVCSLCKFLLCGGISTHRGAHNSSTWGPILVLGPQFFTGAPVPRSYSVGSHMHKGKHQVLLCNRAYLNVCGIGNHNVTSSGLDTYVYPWWWLYCGWTMFIACCALETFKAVQVNPATTEHEEYPTYEENVPAHQK